MNIISKIFTERSVVYNKHFKIVEDKFPICKNHILAFSSERRKSALSHDSNQLFDLLNDVKAYCRGVEEFF